MVSGLQRLVVGTFDREPSLATFSRAGAPDVELEGIFRDAQDQEIDVLGGSVNIAARQPVFHVRESDLPDGKVVEGDRLTVRGKVWEVANFQADGEGIATLELVAKGTA